mmetsp:Transcript_3981/g.8806  ORF Transcript_3981/g.8806 Transcript_3981/m.8806 type:complete len:236 (-) Transcript_3981:470-1177(-)
MGNLLQHGAHALNHGQYANVRLDVRPPLHHHLVDPRTLLAARGQRQHAHQVRLRLIVPGKEGVGFAKYGDLIFDPRALPLLGGGDSRSGRRAVRVVRCGCRGRVGGRWILAAAVRQNVQDGTRHGTFHLVAILPTTATGTIIPTTATVTGQSRLGSGLGLLLLLPLLHQHRPQAQIQRLGAGPRSREQYPTDGAIGRRVQRAGQRERLHRLFRLRCRRFRRRGRRRRSARLITSR